MLVLLIPCIDNKFFHVDLFPHIIPLPIFCFTYVISRVTLGLIFFFS